ncbi:diguanylate cyclase domain-containing protein [Zavarzinia sp. CC-PAN008]|uniref:sensor domain-containing diguanylate cyclase n=1 Tax=Zavarzinia sp. CC-PAN008 TaxID=3243332 RepID=UPI003F744659
MPHIYSADPQSPAHAAMAALVLEMGGSAVCVYDAEDRILYWNERYLAFFPEVRAIIRPGLPFVDTLKAFFAVQHPGAPAENLEAAVAMGMHRHWTETGPLTYQRGDSGRWLELRMIPLLGGGRLKIWTDVTFEWAPQSLGEDVLSLLTIANVGIILHDADGQRVYVNTRYFSERFMDITRRLPPIATRHVRGAWWAGFAELFEPDEAFTALVADPAGGPLAGPVVLRARNGRWFRIEEQSWRGGGIASVWIEVTDLKRQELALEASHAELAILNRQLQTMAAHDGLTDLPNRRAFNAHLATVQARLRAAGGAACVAILDLDRFKAINDRLGHAMGDHALIEAARRLRAMLAAGEFVARLGGEEFALVLSGIGLDQAALRLEAFRTALAETPFVLGGEAVAVTASFGVAALLPGRDGSRSLNLADKALYMSKHLGRNQVSVDDTPAD